VGWRKTLGGSFLPIPTCYKFWFWFRGCIPVTLTFWPWGGGVNTLATPPPQRPCVLPMNSDLKNNIFKRQLQPSTKNVVQLEKIRYDMKIGTFFIWFWLNNHFSGYTIPDHSRCGRSGLFRPPLTPVSTWGTGMLLFRASGTGGKRAGAHLDAIFGRPKKGDLVEPHPAAWRLLLRGVDAFWRKDHPGRSDLRESIILTDWSIDWLIRSYLFCVDIFLMMMMAVFYRPVQGNLSKFVEFRFRMVFFWCKIQKFCII